MTGLSKQDVKRLRTVANGLTPLIRIGRAGLSQSTVRQASEALDDHELVKFAILQNSSENVRKTASNLSGQLGAVIVQVIGSRFTLYRRSAKKSLARHIL